MPPSPIDRLRRLCLAFPEAHEVEAWSAQTFRVRNKMFATFSDSADHRGAGRPSVWCKAVHVTQEHLIRADPERYFSPPYVGMKGWVGIYVDRKPDWKAIAELLRDAYRLTAPKRLVATLGDT